MQTSYRAFPSPTVRTDREIIQNVDHDRYETGQLKGQDMQIQRCEDLSSGFRVKVQLPNARLGEEVSLFLALLPARHDFEAGCLRTGVGALFRDGGTAFLGDFAPATGRIA
jgi:hypothetical protein